MGKLSGWRAGCAVSALCVASAIALPGQTFTTLQSFDNTDGANPGVGAVVQATDGNLYGTTPYGGANGDGTVFRISPGGTLTTLHSFCSKSNCTDGENPYGALVQAANGNLYGTTYQGGAMNSGCNAGSCGTVFRITPGGTLTTLYTFCSQSGCPDGGANPYDAGLIQATDGSLYGTANDGGAHGQGTVFKISLSGTLTTLYNFCSQSGCADGTNPLALVQATNGNFYGIAHHGGVNTCLKSGQNVGCGTVFKITATGMLTTLYNFCSQSGCADGASPDAGLVQATDGNFYGTTLSGGANDYGTVFKFAPTGTLTTLYSFCSQIGCTDGEYPDPALLQATDGNFYGITSGGGANGSCELSGSAFGCGTIFKITPTGTLTTLYSFCFQSGCTDGDLPDAALLQDTNGKFYGTASSGGASSACAGGCGTVFSLSVGLGPFVETQPNSAKVGATVKILGTNLTGATSVTFNGAAATFVVVSSSEITTTVPAGATTGKVKVITPHGTLTSNVNFRGLIVKGQCPVR